MTVIKAVRRFEDARGTWTPTGQNPPEPPGAHRDWVIYRYGRRP
jgi:hypothetical protein